MFFPPPLKGERKRQQEGGRRVVEETQVLIKIEQPDHVSVDREGHNERHCCILFRECPPLTTPALQIPRMPPSYYPPPPAPLVVQSETYAETSFSFCQVFGLGCGGKGRARDIRWCSLPLLPLRRAAAVGMFVLRGQRLPTRVGGGQGAAAPLRGGENVTGRYSSESHLNVEAPKLASIASFPCPHDQTTKTKHPPPTHKRQECEMRAHHHVNVACDAQQVRRAAARQRAKKGRGLLPPPLGTPPSSHPTLPNMMHEIVNNRGGSSGRSAPGYERSRCV